VLVQPWTLGPEMPFGVPARGLAARSEVLQAMSDWFERDGLRLASAGSTDVGKVRRINEDSFLVGPGMYAVADGMGGHAAGDVASQLVIDACRDLIGDLPVSLRAVEDLVNEANRRVREHARAAGTEGMGTTLVGVMLFDNGGDDGLVVVNVGDSRCYGWDETGGLVRLTQDHSVVQELVDAGAISDTEAMSHPERNVVTRAIGIEDAVAADFVVLPQLPGQRLLLCSDGVCGQLTDAEIEAFLARPDGPGNVVEALISAVLQGPAPDNATAIVIDVQWDTVAAGASEISDEDITGPRPTRPSATEVPGLIDHVPVISTTAVPGTPSGAVSPISEVPA
jgi:PPM family protein phosphatase